MDEQSKQSGAGSASRPPSRQLFSLIAASKGQESWSYLWEAILFVESILSTSHKFFVSFNGGKDATVVLTLVAFVLHQSSSPRRRQKDFRIPCINFVEPHPLPEVDLFIQDMIECSPDHLDFNLDLTHFPSKDYASQLAKLHQQTPFEVVFMGTRKSDPHCSHLATSSPSDTHKGYPAFLRINPIFNWDHSEVWRVLRGFAVPYCGLYDSGYTYLGNQLNTQPNASLYDQQTGRFKAAYEAKPEDETLSRKHV